MLVSLDEFRHHLGGASAIDTPGRETAARQILSGVQGQLEAHLNRPVEPTMIRQVGMTDSTGFFRFRITPVVKIVSLERVSRDSYAGVVRNPIVVPPPLERPAGYDENLRMIDDVQTTYQDVQQQPGGMQSLWYSTPFIITYIGGYNGYLVDGLKKAIMTVASREYTRKYMHGSNVQQGQPTATTASDQREDGWTQDELIEWDRIRRRTVV